MDGGRKSIAEGSGGRELVFERHNAEGKAEGTGRLAIPTFPIKRDRVILLLRRVSDRV